MKTLRNYVILILALALSQTGCNEDEFLQEEPLDFFSPSNAFVTFGDYEAAVVDLYAQTRDYSFDADSESSADFYGTDIMFDARESNTNNRFGDYAVTLNPTSNMVSWHWERLYKLAASTNTIIGRVAESELTDDQKREITAEASFFRGLAYRHLGYLYGGVPLVLEEVSSTKADFERASPTEILNQMVEDFRFAADDLPGIAEVADGRVSDLVARHYLAETYVALEQWDQAIAATTTVIDDPATALMTERFGSRSDFEGGDVYFDLFRRGNQNRSGGNTEALWVAQMEVDVPGGYLSSTSRPGNNFERNHAPASWTLQDPDGERAVLGWRSDLNVGGRGVSFMRPTGYFENTLWESDFDNDLRNSSVNYIRDFRYDDPASAWFDSSAVEYPGPNLEAQSWRWYPWLSKVTTPGQHPDALYANRELGLLTAGGGSTYTDQYYLRLAETYLLRAEAYLGQGNQAAAAADINTVRARSNATSVASGEVDIDYILDERARELSLEEDRRITLQRLDKLVERVRLYNDHNGPQIQEFHAVWPIPISEIDANIEADLSQNPGY
jgi:hypothetical protein